MVDNHALQRLYVVITHSNGNSSYAAKLKFKEAMTMGVNVIFNGHIYHFEDDATFDELMDQMADSVCETKRDNAILYDDEMD